MVRVAHNAKKGVSITSVSLNRGTIENKGLYLVLELRPSCIGLRSTLPFSIAYSVLAFARYLPFSPLANLSVSNGYELILKLIFHL